MRKYWKSIYYKDCFTINKLVLHVTISHTLARHTSHHNLITLLSSQIIHSPLHSTFWFLTLTFHWYRKTNLATLANMFTVYAILDSFFSPESKYPHSLEPFVISFLKLVKNAAFCIELASLFMFFFGLWIKFSFSTKLHCCVHFSCLSAR